MVTRGNSVWIWLTFGVLLGIIATPFAQKIGTIEAFDDLFTSLDSRTYPVTKTGPQLQGDSGVHLQDIGDSSESSQFIEYYRVRINYSTTSDWSTLKFMNPEHILTMRQIDVYGNPSRADASTDELALNQPSSSANLGIEVGMTVDIALAKEAGIEGVELLLEKGAINSSNVSIYVLVQDKLFLALQKAHDGHVVGQADTNPAFINLDLSQWQDTAIRVIETTNTIPSKMVWAFYYTWYSQGTWSNLNLNDLPITPYDSSDPATMRKHIRDAKAAGIDGFISSWWGPGHSTDDNLRTLLSVAEEEGFKISIYLESLDSGGNPRDISQIRQWLEYAILEYGEHPAFAKIDHKPVIVIWASSSHTLSEWNELFMELSFEGLNAEYIGQGYNPLNLDVFRGLHVYSVFEMSDLPERFRSAVDSARYYLTLNDSVNSKIGIATVQPGYDERNIPGRGGRFQTRDEGDFYRYTFESAVLSDPDWIFINSWNEWSEHTYIEQSELYDDEYLSITEHYASIWKQAPAEIIPVPVPVSNGITLIILGASIGLALSIKVHKRRN